MRSELRRSGTIAGAFCVSLLFGVDLDAAVYRARGVAGLPAQTKIAFAEHAEPLWTQVTQEGVSVRDALTSTCGDQGAATNEYLERKAVELNRVASLDEVVPVGSSVAVPFCFQIEELKPVDVVPGDTVESLLKTHYGVYGPVTQDEVYRLNAAEYPGMSAEEFERHLRPDKDLVLPYASAVRTFTWNPEPLHGTAEMPTPFIAFEGLPKESVLDPFLASFETAENHENPYRFQSIPFVKAQSVESGDKCGVADYSQVAEEVVARFRSELDALQRDNELMATVIIGVVDTGLARNDTFFNELMEVNLEEEEHGKNERDDDQPLNGFDDDVLGVGLERRNGWIYSSPTDRPTGHGTKIATIAVSGLDYEIWRAQMPASPIRLKMVSYSSNIPVPGVDPTVLALGPPYLKGEKVEIVNMSLAAGHNPLPLSNVLKETEDDVLLIVAAGNAESGKGKPLGPTVIFPALYGGRVGDFSRTVLTVGAHDERGRLAYFSNYSHEYVDLLAPGCSVKTRDEHGSTVFENGTSVGTATVAFAAALVRSLGLDDPAQIKNRILAAGDYDPDLATSAWSSARLNLQKAISVRHDVLQFVGGALRFGRIDNGGEIATLCQNAPIPLERIRKVIPNLVSESGREVEFWIEQDVRLQRVRCTQSATDLHIHLVTGDGAVEAVPVSGVRDIVLARF